jgi:2-hydroxycyclohexanecarboxyl-CoA dehydrogenase
VKTAVVTGGSSGIGAAIAARLAADGYNVATLDLNPAAAGSGHIADVTDRAQIDAALAAVRERFGPVTILVNAAGMDGFKRFHDLTWERWRHVINVNLDSVFHCTQAALPDMMEAGWGRIVNISSSSAQSGQPFMTSYVAAKSAVNGLTKALALEYGRTGSRSTRSRRGSSTRPCCASPSPVTCSAARSTSTYSGPRSAGSDGRRISPLPARS